MGEESGRQLIGTVFAVGVAAVLLVVAILRNRKSRELYKRLPPGPKPLPILGNLGEMEQVSHQGFAKLSKKYDSPLIHLWLGSVHLIVANSLETAREILKNQDVNFASRPVSIQSTILAYNNQTISFLPYGQVWRQNRKVLVLELLTATRIRQFQPIRREEVKGLIWALLEESKGEKPVAVNSKIKEHLTNILTRMMMSKSYFGPQAVGSMSSATFQAGCKALVSLLGGFHLGDYIPLLKYWDVQGTKKKLEAAHEVFDNFLQEVIDERKQQLASKKNTGDSELQKKGDFLDVLLTRSVDKDEVELTEEMMKGILQESIIGGVDSSAAAVEWALAELMRHPKVLKKAQDELDTVVGKERLVKEEDVPNLIYIQAIVKEVFRLHPVTPLLMPRHAQEACEIEGYYIPAGSTLFVNVWAIGRDPKLWENPLDFSPERFLGSPIDLTGLHFELTPFGAGRRGCPGLNMGLLLVQFILAACIQSCDWSYLPGKNPEDYDMNEGIGIVNHKVNPLEAIVTRRLPKDVLASAA